MVSKKLTKAVVITVLLISVLISSDVFGGSSAENFYAYYTKIDSGEKFDKYSRAGKYADIVVNLSQGKLVFHRSSSYLPYWQTG